MTHTTKHTPGPWVVRNFAVNGETRSEVLDANGGNACIQSNAHLIAAAPAMYEALKEWCDYYAAYNPIRDKRIEPFIKLTRQALAQAEGK